MSFLGVNVAWDKEGAARKFVQDRKVPYAVGHDKRNRIGRLYRVDATPTTFILDREGEVVAIRPGRIELESLTVVLEQVSGDQ